MRSDLPATIDWSRLRSYGILDTPPEPAFDDIARLAAHICQVPIALVSFVDRDRQWFTSEIGLGLRETSLGASICAHAIAQRGLFVVGDASPTSPVALLSMHCQRRSNSSAV
jgi:GAF domain-containing protein